jgi:5'-nucleotidase, C-terminal domain
MEMDASRCQVYFVNSKLAKIIFCSLAYFLGIRATYNLDLPQGSRLTEILLRCARCRIPEFLPVEPEAWYTVAMPSFLSSGSSFPLITERGKNPTVGNYREI